MGSMFDVAFRKFSAAFEARADEIYGRTPADRAAASSISSAVSTAAEPDRAARQRTEPPLQSRPCSPPRRAEAKWTRPTGFSAVPPSGPAMPVTRDREVGGGMGEGALRHRARRRRADRALSRRGRRLGHAEHLLLGVVGIDDEAALDDRRRAGNFRQQARDQPAGAGFGGGELQPAIAAQRFAAPRRVRPRGARTPAVPFLASGGALAWARARLTYRDSAFPAARFP